KEFKIQTSQLRDWISKKSKLLKAVPYIQKLSIGARPKYPELKTELIEWFRGLRSQNKTVNRYMIQAKAHALCATSCFQERYRGIGNHKFSQKQVDGFMSRNNLVNRKHTTTAQHLPETYWKIKMNFYLLYFSNAINIIILCY